jgi:outer membrane receptor protein involved in Fe transport
MNFPSFRLLRVIGALLLAVLVLPALPARAQGTATASVSGTITAEGRPVGGAAVALRGAVTQTTRTDAQGRYTFNSVPAGVYQVVVTKAGFFQSIATVAVAAGAAVTEDIALTAQSFTSLRTIAHVSTAAAGVAPINQSTAAINTISSQQFQDQGQIQVTKILNETPGIIAMYTPNGLAANGADQFSPETIQIRGALPYETETLIDGHATALELSGAFNPILLNPALLQDVEVVKGPGSMPTEINYAIGGTVNFITLQPTRVPEAYVTAGVDNWGGVFTAAHITGSTLSNFLQYAFGYATDGAPGPMQNYQVAGGSIFLIAGRNAEVNGQQLLSSPYNIGFAPQNRYNRYIGLIPGAIDITQPFYVCCAGVNSDFDGKSELGKLRLNFSQSTSFTMSFLGGQGSGHIANTGVLASDTPVGTLPNSSFGLFEPPAGYSGSVAPGTDIPFGETGFLPAFEYVEQNLFQGTFRTTFGDWTALARYFEGGGIDSIYLDVPPNKWTFVGNAWGGATVCPKGTTFNSKTGLCGGLPPVQEFFNGQRTAFTAFDATNQSLEDDHLRGGSFQLERPFANGDDLELAIDRTHHDAYSFVNVPTSGLPPYYSYPPGASQEQMTESLRLRGFVAPNVMANLADYLIQYTSHFTDNGGGLVLGSGPNGGQPPASWHDSGKTYNAPRIAFTWQPNENISWRFAAGASIAPPLLSLLSSIGNNEPTEIENGTPQLGYIESLNSGNVAPETAFGYDIGVDKRFHSSWYVSFDAYLENLRNMYLNSTHLVTNTYLPPPPPGSTTSPCAPNGCPLLATQTQNLGHARYEGVELAFGDRPISGVGFTLQGSLERAYPYDLPQGFYCSTVAASKCTPFYYDTNLGVIPNINFQASGAGYNGLGISVPYAMGYGELNYRTLAGSFYQIGATYYGNNNTYSQPPFVIISAGIRQALGSHLALQLTADNLTDQESQLFTASYGGQPVVLEPECIGKYGGPLYLAEGSTCSGTITAFQKLGVNLRKYATVIPQEGLPVGGNYGPTMFRLQLIDRFGGP